jgi:hypothetical protein
MRTEPMTNNRTTGTKVARRRPVFDRPIATRAYARAGPVIVSVQYRDHPTSIRRLATKGLLSVLSSRPTCPPGQPLLVTLAVPPHRE